MRHQRTRKNILSVLISVISVAAIAVWQFYAFVTFKNQPGLVDVQGGRLHFRLAAFGFIACVAAFLFFSTFLRYVRSNEMHITSRAS
jgi:Kef-type K+ transport system membrane component KefB